MLHMVNIVAPCSILILLYSDDTALLLSRKPHPRMSRLEGVVCKSVCLYDLEQLKVSSYKLTSTIRSNR